MRCSARLRRPEAVLRRTTQRPVRDRHDHRPLQDFVLQRRNANGSRLLAHTRFGDVHAAHSWRSIPAGLEPLQQAGEVRLQRRLILRRRDPVHPHRAALPRAAIGLLEPTHIDVVSQRREHPRRRVPRQGRYLPLFR